MSEFEDKHIEQAFKEAADKFVPAYNPNAWTQMQAKMALEPVRVVFWNTTKIIIGVLLLVSAIGVVYFISSNNQAENFSSKEGAEMKLDEYESNKFSEQLINDSVLLSDSNQLAYNETNLEVDNNEKPSEQLKQERSKLINETDKEQEQIKVVLNDLMTISKDEVTVPEIEQDGYVEVPTTESEVFENEGLLGSRIISIESKLLENDAYENVEIFYSPIVYDSTRTEEEKTKSDFRKLAVSILFSPDFSGTEPTKMKDTGIDIGLILEYFFHRKISLNAGAQYSSKKYLVEEGFEGYASRWPARTEPDEIDASCTVIDIPINLRYYFYENTKTRMFFNTGVTSYIMLTEDYLYKYTYTGVANDWAIKIENENKHFFGILNFSFGLQKSIGKGFYVVGEPFYKIPLQGIGAGAVNLHSSGLYISIKKDL